VHPWAWWCWAIGIGLAVSGTTNPLFLALIATAMVAVVMLRRSDAPWARSVRAYLMLSAFVIGMRMFFQILLGGGHGQTVVFTLPSIPLPQWAAGIQLGGAVTAEALTGTLYDALRLAVMLLAIGAANALANPRQALRSVPAALYEASVAVVIALSVAPQLIESVQRVRRARRLRGDSATSLKSLATIAMPVLADAIDRSMALAAGMESRGFARTRGVPTKGTLPLMLSASMAATIGVFLLLSTDFWQLACLLLVAGLFGSGLGLRLAGRRLRVTSYRRLPWTARDTAIAASGVLAAVIVLTLGWLDPDALSPALAGLLDPLALSPSTDPLVWPTISLPMIGVLGMVLAAIPLSRERVAVQTASVRNDRRVRSLRPRVERELVYR
jgi:ABC-type cobalt transport system, permease component CbiQ and related transporters